MFRTKLIHLGSSVRNSVRNSLIRRHNSTVPTTLVSYMKDKGIYIPMAKSILSQEEYAKYELYRQIKLGDHKWLDAHISAHPLGKEEQTSLTEYISDLKKQPYNIPNFGIGYLISNLSVKTFMFVGQFQLLGLTETIFPTSALDFVMGSIATLSVIPTTAVCYSMLKHGMTIFINEFKSPYYNYDEMTRICNKSIDTESIYGKAHENEQ